VIVLALVVAIEYVLISYALHGDLSRSKLILEPQSIFPAM